MAEQKTLVVYYSRTGTTRQIAHALANALYADTEEIVATGNHAGVFGYLRSVIEARRRTSSAIAAVKKDPSAYDLVIVGTPVWAWSLSSPVRAWLAANKEHLPAVAFFCTLGGAGSDKAFGQMQEIAGKPPRATLAVNAADVIADRYAPALASFVTALEPGRRSETTPSKTSTAA
ncbi:flavodoxin family protein [Rhodopseudomonas sp. RCAM05734]|uniref:flavodoxin family protein n=1 Tax=Rhodopseudomonas sp. RCAM05734 TaxID=3457549 RepID=UPI004043986B